MLKFYIIKYKKTDECIIGTDFNYSPPKQQLSNEYPPMIFTECNLQTEIKRRAITLRKFTPTLVEITEPKHGYWKRVYCALGDPAMECSNCKKWFMRMNANYCPNCGVKMIEKGGGANA